MNIIIAIFSAGAMGSAKSVRLKEHGARVLTLLDGRSAATVDRVRAAVVCERRRSAPDEGAGT